MKRILPARRGRGAPQPCRQLHGEAPARRAKSPFYYLIVAKFTKRRNPFSRVPGNNSREMPSERGVGLPRLRLLLKAVLNLRLRLFRENGHAVSLFLSALRAATSLIRGRLSGPAAQIPLPKHMNESRKLRRGGDAPPAFIDATANSSRRAARGRPYEAL